MKKLFYFKRIYFFCLVLVIGFSSNINAQSCVGTPGQVKWSFWTGFGSSLPDSADLTALENFPSRPDGSQLLSSLKMPVNYNEYFAAMARGYIYVNETANYTFNLTGDDRAIFYLSTNESVANKQKRAEVISYTEITEHTKSPKQTSRTIQLVAGQNYYFELYSFEGCCSDHTTLYWRKLTNPDTTWRVIDFNNIRQYACEQSCPARGTACNDGNAATTDDRHDGFCNCVGIMPTTNACVGERGRVDAYYFDNIQGSFVEPDLINAPKFPLLPDRKEELKGLSGPEYTSVKDNYGSLVQGYISVPVSGTYEFNLTGDDQTMFFLSKNDSIQYKQYHQAMVIFGVDESAHSVYSFQNTSPLYLEKGRYYYYEIRHKENGWRDHFNLYWKTPFHEVRTWKKVSDFYLYDYKCEISCIPDNTPCNDGNAYTKNDKFLNCECKGTPCTGPDCDDVSAQYQFYDSCAPTLNITNTNEIGWVSCAASANPNPARSGLNHWIKYDFGNKYAFQGTRVWNYNAVNETNKGFKKVYVDYSADGIVWKQLGGVYSWPAAPGTAQYAGFSGPDFNNLTARYILLTATENWGHTTCAGFSKITFNATQCQGLNTACDDGDPLTVYDKFDDNCTCKGVKLACLEDTIVTGKVTLLPATHQAKKVILSRGDVPTAQNIAFTAGNSIVLLPGFEVHSGAAFSAKIQGCLQTALAQNQTVEKSDLTATEFETEATEQSGVKRIIFRLNKPGQVKLLLKNKKSEIVATIIDDYYQNLGTQVKYLPVTRLPQGKYTVELTVNDTKITQQFAVE